MNKPLKLKIDIYSFEIEFSVDKDENEPDRLFVTTEDRREQKLKMLVSNEWGSATDSLFLQCLSHECNHAAMIILGRSNVYFDYHNQEVLCYLQDYIFRKCYEYAKEVIK